jgi:hypothetical protein
LNNDGHLDLAIAGDFHTSRLFWNNGDGTFTDGTLSAGVGTEENGMGSTIADFNNDGHMDWFVTSIHNTYDDNPGNWGTTGNRLFRNNGDQTFTDVTTAAGVRDGDWGWASSAFDYDNDGHLDIVMTNGFPVTGQEVDFANDPMRLFRNNGDGTFSSRRPGATGHGSNRRPGATGHSPNRNRQVAPGLLAYCQVAPGLRGARLI